MGVSQPTVHPFEFISIFSLGNCLGSYVTIYSVQLGSYTPYIEGKKKYSGVIPGERRESEFGIDQIDSLSLSGYYAQDISTISRLSVSPLVISVFSRLYIYGVLRTPYCV